MAPANLALIILLFGAAGDSPAQHNQYVGDAGCVLCHREQSDSFAKTAHHLTSQAANKDSILGSLREGSNVLMIADPAKAGDNPGLYFKMESKRDGYYQTAVAGWPGQLQSRSERMDLVIGSGNFCLNCRRATGRMAHGGSIVPAIQTAL
jgi:hypothetical protein